MAHARRKSINTGIFLAAFCLGCSLPTMAGQKIIFSAPYSPVEASPSEIASRKELLRSKSSPVISLGRPSPENFNPGAAAIPDVFTGQKKEKKDSLFGDDSTDDLQGDRKNILAPRKDSRLEKGWDSKSDPLSAYSETSRSRGGSLKDDLSSEKSAWASRSDLESRRSREVYSLSLQSDGGRNDSSDRLQEDQAARIEAFKKLYDYVPTAAAPRNDPYAMTVPTADNPPWGAQQQPAKRSPNDLYGSSTSAQDPYSRGASPTSSRGFGESTESRNYNPGYHEQVKDPNQRDPNARQPVMLNIPKRPGSLF